MALLALGIAFKDGGWYKSIYQFKKVFDFLFSNAIAAHETALEERHKHDSGFSILLHAREREKDMLVVNRRKLLPAVTVGLTRDEADKLANVLRESNIEINFCLDLLTDIDLVALEEKIVNNR